MPLPSSILVLPLILLVYAASLYFQDSPSASSFTMAPEAFELRLQNGILGGFAPPRPTAIYMISRDQGESSIDVRVQRVENDMESEFSKFPVEKLEAQINRIVSILKQLPTENPPQSEDIYGLNIGISWTSEDFSWVNSAPQGCMPGISDKPATEDEKALFKEAVDIVTEIAQAKETDEL